MCSLQPRLREVTSTCPVSLREQRVDVVDVVPAVEDQKPAGVRLPAPQGVTHGTDALAGLAAAAQTEFHGEFAEAVTLNVAVVGVDPPHHVVVRAEAVGVLGGELGLADAGHTEQRAGGSAALGVGETLVEVREQIVAAREPRVATRDLSPDLGACLRVAEPGGCRPRGTAPLQAESAQQTLLGRLLAQTPQAGRFEDRGGRKQRPVGEIDGGEAVRVRGDEAAQDVVPLARGARAELEEPVVEDEEYPSAGQQQVTERVLERDLTRRVPALLGGPVAVASPGTARSTPPTSGGSPGRPPGSAPVPLSRGLPRSPRPTAAVPPSQAPCSRCVAPVHVPQTRPILHPVSPADPGRHAETRMMPAHLPGELPSRKGQFIGFKQDGQGLADLPRYVSNCSAARRRHAPGVAGPFHARHQRSVSARCAYAPWRTPGMGRGSGRHPTRCRVPPSGRHRGMSSWRAASLCVMGLVHQDLRQLRVHQRAVESVRRLGRPGAWRSSGHRRRLPTVRRVAPRRAAPPVSAARPGSVAESSSWASRQRCAQSLWAECGRSAAGRRRRADPTGRHPVGVQVVEDDRAAGQDRAARTSPARHRAGAVHPRRCRAAGLGSTTLRRPRRP